MTRPETPYVETELLLAIMNDDREEQSRLLGTMSTMELLGFSAYANTLAGVVAREWTARRDAARRDATVGDVPDV